MNEHERFQDDLPLYATGDLDPEAVEALSSHLEECPECVAELAGLYATVGGLHAVSEREDRGRITGRVALGARLRKSCWSA